jgi:hypothetical protein
LPSAQLEEELPADAFALAFEVKRTFKLSKGWKTLMKSAAPEVAKLKARDRGGDRHQAEEADGEVRRRRRGRQ